MLETDDVDIDFFTPVSSTSLSKIFKISTVEEKDNTSLKYVPLPSQNDIQKQEESKPTQCIYACPLFGYEWLNGAYINRGKLGFAVLKIVKTGQHNIVLYDSQKVTLSCTTISTNFEMSLKETTNLSYYDSSKKYWTVYGTETYISQIIEKLKALGVKINNLSNIEKESTEFNNEEQNSIKFLNTFNDDDKESDTDSSINRRTKHSILRRMATMGHSVLPTQNICVTKLSDSSDSDISAQKLPRHKGMKIDIKRSTADKKHCKKDSCIDSQLRKVVPELKESNNIPVNTYVSDQQLVPMKSNNVITNPVISNTNELNVCMTEQRINHNELRMNMNRMADKIDQILESVKDAKNSSTNHSTLNFQNNVVQKLLNEYENKIKAYEEFIKSQGLNYTNNKLGIKYEQKQNIGKNEISSFEIKILELEEQIKEKDMAYSQIKNELQALQEKIKYIHTDKNIKENDQLKDISEVKQELHLKNEVIAKYSKENQELLQYSKFTKTKIKSIMNNVFHVISANFEDNENYIGATVKEIISTIIKKETREALMEIK